MGKHSKQFLIQPGETANPQPWRISLKCEISELSNGGPIDPEEQKQRQQTIMFAIKNRYIHSNWYLWLVKS